MHKFFFIVLYTSGRELPFSGKAVNIFVHQFIKLCYVQCTNSQRHAFQEFRLLMCFWGQSGQPAYIGAPANTRLHMLFLSLLAFINRTFSYDRNLPFKNCPFSVIELRVTISQMSVSYHCCINALLTAACTSLDSQVLKRQRDLSLYHILPRTSFLTFMVYS